MRVTCVVVTVLLEGGIGVIFDVLGKLDSRNNVSCCVLLVTTSSKKLARE